MAKKRGRRPKVEQHEGEYTVETVVKEDAPSPHHEQRVKQANSVKVAKSGNKVLEKYYELRDGKLILVREKANGSCYRSYVGRTNKKEVAEFAKKLDREGRLKKRV